MISKAAFSRGEKPLFVVFCRKKGEKNLPIFSLIWYNHNRAAMIPRALRARGIICPSRRSSGEVLISNFMPLPARREKPAAGGGNSDITTRRTLRRVKKKRIFRAAFTKKQPQIMLLPGAALKMLGIRKYCRVLRLAPKQNIENPREEPV